MKITGSKIVGVGRVPPVTPVAALGNKLPPRYNQLTQPTEKPQNHGVAQPDAVISGERSRVTAPPLVELYGPNGKLLPPGKTRER